MINNNHISVPYTFTQIYFSRWDNTVTIIYNNHTEASRKVSSRLKNCYCHFLCNCSSFPVMLCTSVHFHAESFYLTYYIPYLAIEVGKGEVKLGEGMKG